MQKFISDYSPNSILHFFHGEKEIKAFLSALSANRSSEPIVITDLSFPSAVLLKEHNFDLKLLAKEEFSNLSSSDFIIVFIGAMSLSEVALLIPTDARLSQFK
jgi:HrpA-like RNA helicase